MEENYFELLIKKIVEQASELKNIHTKELTAPVNYACVFSQNQKEFNELFIEAKKIGRTIKETPTGPLFQINPIQTKSGKLQILKIRHPDEARPERGDADFTVSNYPNFKKTHLSKKGFKLIDKKDFEMIELMNSDFNVRAYFSNPPLTEQFGID